MLRRQKNISIAWLRERRACAYQVAIVRKEWGDGEIELTETTLFRAAALQLNLDWLARNILLPTFWAKFLRDLAPFLDKLNESLAPLRDKFEMDKARLLAKLIQTEIVKGNYES